MFFFITTTLLACWLFFIIHFYFTVLCARNLARKDLFRKSTVTNLEFLYFPTTSVLYSISGLPDTFAKVAVDGTGQVFTTEPCKASLDPKWNVHYDLFLGRNDGITISVWNERKVHKKQGGGFLGCVRILASTIQRLKDTGCKKLMTKSMQIYV